MQNKKTAILQSNYIPWKGYFDLINRVDEFIFYDSVQYTKNDWRNRNLIKTPQGLLWLSIPIKTKGHISNRININEAQTTDNRWRKKHWACIANNYSKAPYFKDYKDIFKALYLDDDERFLAGINYKFILKINEILGIKTKISYSEDFVLNGNKTERLVNLCLQTKASEYISGPAAKNYIDENLFNEAGIKLSWMDYSGYREYRQLYPPFTHGVSVLDLIFNCGSNAVRYIER